MPGTKRSYSGHRRSYRPRKRFRFTKRYGRQSAASVIQKAFRRRRARNRVHRSMQDYAVKKFNRARKEMLYKSFTVLAPDTFITNPGTGTLTGLGIVQTDGAGNVTECFELGMLLKDNTAPNGVAPISPEFQNYLELFRQVKVVHASVTLLKYNRGLGDGQPSTGTPPTSSIGITGNKNFVSYLHSVIDTGTFKPVDQLQNLAIPAITNIASLTPNEYLSNSNSRFQQVSWDTKKSIKTKVLCATTKEEWAAQYYGIFSNAVPPVANSQLRCNCPWIDTAAVEAVCKNQLPAGHPNYLSLYSLTRLPPVSFYGNGFPTRVSTAAGIPNALKAPLFKCLISVTCAFRVPTTRN